MEPGIPAPQPADAVPRAAMVYVFGDGKVATAPAWARWGRYAQRGSYPVLKRVLDVGLTLVSLPFWALAIAGLACLVRWRLGTPVLFRQERTGLNGAVFWMIKFRTMSDGRDAHGKRLPDEARLGGFGRWLRSTSLDELPELLCVLAGNMSLVGPRPLLPRYLERYSASQRRRHDVPPGLTGWAQIHGRNSVSWEEKFRLDVWYAEHAGLGLDAWILWRTVAKVLRREGVSAAGEATMPEFTGSSSEEGGRP